jgi:beta-lactam-binding protein with PASTA domain
VTDKAESLEVRVDMNNIIYSAKTVGLSPKTISEIEGMSLEEAQAWLRMNGWTHFGIDQNGVVKYTKAID